MALCGMILVCLDMNPLSAGGMSGTAVINGRTFTSKQCFQNALSFNENDGTTWFHLGCGLTSGETVRHNKRRYTKLQCLVNAIQFGPGLSLLVRSMGHRVDPKRSDIWCAIGKEVPDGDTILVDENARSSIACFRMALMKDPHHKEAWRCLGNALSKRGSQCLWSAIGCSLTSGNTPRGDDHGAAGPPPVNDGDGDDDDGEMYYSSSLSVVGLM